MENNLLFEYGTVPKPSYYVRLKLVVFYFLGSRGANSLDPTPIS